MMCAHHRIPLLVAGLALVAVTAVPTAAADATVDPVHEEPPTPGDPPPGVYGAVSYLAGYTGEALGWAGSEAGAAGAEAFGAAVCTIENVFGECAYVVVLDEHGDKHYVSVSKAADDNGVWEEANGCDGLQREAVDCRGDADVEPADRRVA